MRYAPYADVGADSGAPSSSALDTPHCKQKALCVVHSVTIFLMVVAAAPIAPNEGALAAKSLYYFASAILNRHWGRRHVPVRPGVVLEVMIILPSHILVLSQRSSHKTEVNLLDEMYKALLPQRPIPKLLDEVVLDILLPYSRR